MRPGRLKHWDYGSAGFYFVTFNTHQKQNFFGKIISEGSQNIATPAAARLEPTVIGKVAIENWRNIPEHFPFVVVDEFVVMPDHVHGLLYFDLPPRIGGAKNKFGPQSQNLGSVIRGYKASVKAYATANKIEFKWQSSYQCNIVWGMESLIRVRNYIRANPRKWLEKKMRSKISLT